MRTPRLPVVDWTDAPRQVKWTRPFRWKTKSGFCACAVTFETCYTCLIHLRPTQYFTFRACTHLFCVRTCNKLNGRWFQVSPVLTMTASVVWSVTPCSLVYEVMYHDEWSQQVTPKRRCSSARRNDATSYNSVMFTSVAFPTSRFISSSFVWAAFFFPPQTLRHKGCCWVKKLHLYTCPLCFLELHH